MTNYIENLKRSVVLNSGLNYEETLVDYNILKSLSEDLEQNGIVVMSEQFQTTIEGYLEKKEMEMLIDSIDFIDLKTKETFMDNCLTDVQLI